MLNLYKDRGNRVLLDRSQEYPLVGKGMDVNEQENLSNFTLGHRLK